VRRGDRLVDVAYAHQVDVRVDDVDVLREQVAHSPLQGCRGFLVPTPDPQEAKRARFVEAGRHNIPPESRSRLGARLDREPEIRVDALEQLAVRGRQGDLPWTLVEGTVRRGGGRSAPWPGPAEAAHRGLRRDHPELECRLAVALRGLGALAERMDRDSIAEDRGKAALPRRIERLGEQPAKDTEAPVGG